VIDNEIIYVSDISLCRDIGCAAGEIRFDKMRRHLGQGASRRSPQGHWRECVNDQSLWVRQIKKTQPTAGGFLFGSLAILTGNPINQYPESPDPLIALI